MKVFLAYWCNNEPYEDYHETVDGVFSTSEGAEAFIVGKGYRPHVCVDEWEKRNMAGRFDKRVDEYEMHSMWIREMEVDA